jgi:hypothetical protein
MIRRQEIQTIGIIALGGLLTTALTLSLAGCPKPPPPSPMPPDATDGAPAPSDADLQACALACQQLAALGCAEGAAPTCVSRLTEIEILKMEPNKSSGNRALQCSDFATVKSAADVVAMGQTCTLTGK